MINQFIWLNPVALARYGTDEIEQALRAKKITPVQCLQDHMTTVREAYRCALETAAEPVADTRCPLAVDYLKRTYRPPLSYLHIEPILLHCARELHERYCGQGQLTITTPCVPLAKLGNALKLEHTVFIAWDDFAIQHGIALTEKPLHQSPIPPGFFEGLGRVRALASKREIDEYFSLPQQGSYDIYELLYCTQGCHNHAESLA